MENKISQLLTGQTTESEDEDLFKELEFLMASSAPNNHNEIQQTAAVGISSNDAAVVDNVVKPILLPQPLPPRIPEEKQIPLSFPDVPSIPILPMVPTTTPSTAKDTSTTNRQPVLS